MGSKICAKCRRELSLCCFNKNSHRRDGLQSYCRECSSVTAAEYKKTPRGREVTRKNNLNYIRNLEKTSLFQQKKSSRNRATQLKRRGILPPFFCFYCGPLVAGGHVHHDDYGKPLSVRYMCAKHHNKWHQLFIAEGQEISCG